MSDMFTSNNNYDVYIYINIIYKSIQYTKNVTCALLRAYYDLKRIANQYRFKTADDGGHNTSATAHCTTTDSTTVVEKLQRNQQLIHREAPPRPAGSARLGLGTPKGASIDRLSGAGASAGVLSSTLGVARCGGSAGCVLCTLWAVPAAVLGGGVPCGGKHIIIVSQQPSAHSSARHGSTRPLPCRPRPSPPRHRRPLPKDVGQPSYLCSVLFARAPVLGLCFCVSVTHD